MKKTQLPILKLWWVNACLMAGAGLGSAITMLLITWLLTATNQPDLIVRGTLYAAGGANILMCCYFGLLFDWGNEFPEKPAHIRPFAYGVHAFFIAFIDLLFFIGWFIFIRNTIRNFRHHR